MSVSALQTHAFALRLADLAEDVGRLRRRVREDEYALHLVGRIAIHVEMIDSFLAPCASEIFAANVAYCGDEDEAAAAALEDVDARALRLRALLGETGS